MKVKVVKEFYDRDKEAYVKPGTTIEVSDKKQDKLLSAGVAEEVKQTKAESAAEKG